MKTVAIYIIQPRSLLVNSYEKTFNHYFYINIFNYRLYKEKEYFMNLDWDLIWKIFQVVSLLIIAREIDKRIRKRKKSK